MGYYTDYDIEVKDGGDVDHIKNIQIETGNGFLFEYGTKWRTRQKDMKNYSLHHPDTLFTLKGLGEESPDVWIEYYKNGKVQVCPGKITFDPFDEGELK